MSLFRTATVALTIYVWISTAHAYGQEIAYSAEYLSSADVSVKVIDLSAKRVLATVPLNRRGIPESAISPDGRMLCVGGEAGITFINTSSYEKRYLDLSTVINAVMGGISKLVFSPDGASIYAELGNFHPRLIAIDSATLEFVILSLNLDWLADLAPSPDAGRLYAVEETGAAHVIDLKTGKESGRFQILANEGTSGAAVSPDGGRLYVNSCLPSPGLDAAPYLGGGLSVIDTKTQTTARIVPLQMGSCPYAIAITPDGARAYIAEASGTIELVDLIDWKVSALTVSPAISGAPTRIAVAPDGNTLWLLYSEYPSRSSTLVAIDLAAGGITTFRVDSYLYGFVFAPAPPSLQKSPLAGAASPQQKVARGGRLRHALLPENGIRRAIS